MLYGYPTEATGDNWLHECLCEMLQSIHTSLREGKRPRRWPTIIPEARRPKLNGRTGLRNRLRNYREKLATLTPQDQDRVLNALENQNKIPDLLSCTCDCDAIFDLPEAIREPAKDLFSFTFGLLTDFGVRDAQYEKIYGATQYAICPFCGCEYFDAPGAPREDLDHYLPKDRYPFAAANLRNLVPMGTKCNSRYKLTQDILKKEGGTRRRSFDPYDNVSVKISLDNSVPFAGSNGQVPEWQIEFDPDIEEATTWDDVFHIRERYRRDVLDPSFNSWLRDFSSWCRFAQVRPTSHEGLMETVKRYGDYLDTMGVRDRAFLKVAVFRMLHNHCSDGNQRLLAFMNDLVGGTDGQAV